MRVLSFLFLQYDMAGVSKQIFLNSKPRLQAYTVTTGYLAVNLLLAVKQNTDVYSFLKGTISSKYS